MLGLAFETNEARLAFVLLVHFGALSVLMFVKMDE